MKLGMPIAYDGSRAVRLRVVARGGGEHEGSGGVADIGRKIMVASRADAHFRHARVVRQQPAGPWRKIRRGGVVLSRPAKVDQWLIYLPHTDRALKIIRKCSNELHRRPCGAARFLGDCPIEGRSGTRSPRTVN